MNFSNPSWFIFIVESQLPSTSISIYLVIPCLFFIVDEFVDDIHVRHTHGVEAVEFVGIHGVEDVYARSANTKYSNYVFLIRDQPII